MTDLIDITQFAVAETSTLPLLKANDEPLLGADGKQASITVYGPGSKAYAEAQTKQQALAIEKLRKKGKLDQTPAQRAAEQADFLAACTVSFNGFTYPGFPAGGAEMFKAAYSDATIGFIAEQVAKHIGDWGNFSKA